MRDLERADIDKIKTQLENCLFIAYDNIKKNKDIKYEQFESYFSKLEKEIDIQIKNQDTIKVAITDIFNVM